MAEEKKDGRFRPPDKKRTEKIEVMLTPSERQQAIADAESRGMRISEHVRDLLKKWTDSLKTKKK